MSIFIFVVHYYNATNNHFNYYPPMFMLLATHTMKRRRAGLELEELVADDLLGEGVGGQLQRLGGRHRVTHFDSFAACSYGTPSNKQNM